MKKGERINEARLAKQFGISRNPIREALRQLVQEGLVIYKPNIGTVVAEVTMADVRTAAEIRIFLETRAVEILKEDGRLQETTAMLERIARQMALLGNGPITVKPEELDARFHQALVEASGSHLLQRLWNLMDPYTYGSLQPDPVRARSSYSAEEHSRRHLSLVLALSGGDLPEIRTALVAHLRGDAARVERAPST